MFPRHSVRSLYSFALAEGEGVGTAYEYYAKRLVLAKCLASLRRPRRLLIAGLPQKYGSSLDWFLLAEDFAVGEFVVADERASALEKCRGSVAAVQKQGRLAAIRPHYVLLSDMASLDPLSAEFDLCLSSEVLQRLSAETRRCFVGRVLQLAPTAAFFAPNADNPSHTEISGLSGLTVAEVHELVSGAGIPCGAGYVDMPPFPPGITRSAAQRQQAATGRLETFAMWGLGMYAGLERVLPGRWVTRHAHIVYAVAQKPNISNPQPNRG